MSLRGIITGREIVEIKSIRFSVNCKGLDSQVVPGKSSIFHCSQAHGYCVTCPSNRFRASLGNHRVEFCEPILSEYFTELPPQKSRTERIIQYLNTHRKNGQEEI
jgi:hypothetical protein